jgi:hypothetical protein
MRVEVWLTREDHEGGPCHLYRTFRLISVSPVFGRAQRMLESLSCRPEAGGREVAEAELLGRGARGWSSCCYGGQRGSGQLRLTLMFGLLYSKIQVV